MEAYSLFDVFCELVGSKKKAKDLLRKFMYEIIANYARFDKMLNALKCSDSFTVTEKVYLSFLLGSFYEAQKYMLDDYGYDLSSRSSLH